MKSSSIYLLDTNICIFIINKRDQDIVDKIKGSKLDEICISSITIGELEYGLQKSIKKNKNREALIEFLSPFRILDFGPSDAYEYGKIRALLESRGEIIGPYDLQIAAQALARRLVLVTNNVKEFVRVPNLKIEDWSKGE